jgi:hypothetical protein
MGIGHNLDTMISCVILHIELIVKDETNCNLKFICSRSRGMIKERFDI